MFSVPEEVSMQFFSSPRANHNFACNAAKCVFRFTLTETGYAVVCKT